MSHGGGQLKQFVEAALFTADTPLTIDRIISLFPDDGRPSREEVHEALGELQADYTGRGITLKQIDNSYRFQSREEHASVLRKLWEGRAPRYSRALLETLAIIAYRQPVTRGEIEEIRGVSVSSEIVKTLLNREWIRQVGHRDVPGRPALFGTTRGFLEHFGLKSLSELPSLAELRDIQAIASDLNMSLDLEPVIDDGNEPTPVEAKGGPASTENEDIEVVTGGSSTSVAHE